MSDPVGLIGGAGGIDPQRASIGPSQANKDGGADFKAMLSKNLDEVNAAQKDADRAIEDLVIGRRQDVEGVIVATQKADTAFRMLQSMRNKVMQAYDEIKQIR